MSHNLRFQVMLIPSVPWPQFLDRFLRVESLGFDVAAMPDHFCDWANPSGPWLEAWTTVAAVAARTSTLRLTTCVTQIPLRNPAILANQAVTADQISGGRIELGLGTGLTIDPSYEMTGLPNWSNGERVDRFGEYVELLGQPAGRRRDDLPRHLLPGQRSRDEPWLGAATALADHGRRVRAEDDASRGATCRHLEHDELRRRPRGATRRVDRPLHRDGRDMRRHRP